MGDSASDSESDCYESANESLEEDEKEDIKIKSKKHTRKSDTKNEGSVSYENWDDENLCQDSKSIGDHLVTYRKRPERARTDSNKSPPKMTVMPKVASQNKSSHKIDAPDIFFQDLTSNFSKNINKSFNSLQQTSSNVKDLILNSLPISNVKESTEFSYDDNRIVEENLSDNQVEPLKNKESNIGKDENYQHGKSKLCDTFNLSKEEKKTKINKINIESNQSESIKIKSENLGENKRLPANNFKLEENIGKEMLDCNNFENKSQKNENNQGVDNVVLENQITFKDTKSAECSDSSNSDIAKEQLEESFEDIHDKLHKQNESVKLFTKEALNNTIKNKLLCNDTEVRDSGNSFCGMKMADSLSTKLDNSTDFHMNYEKRIEGSNDDNLNKHDHKLFKNVEPLETFKSIDAFIGMFEEKKRTDVFDNRKLKDNLENNFFADRVTETFIKNADFSDFEKKTITSKKDCVISDQCDLKNETLTNNNNINNINNTIIINENKNISQNANLLELNNLGNENIENLDQKPKKSEIYNVTECDKNLEETKHVSQIIDDKINFKKDIQSTEINSSLVKEEEGTDGWTDDFSFSENEDDLEQSDDICANERAVKVDVKDLEIKGKHLDTPPKMSTDSLSTMSGEEYEENDVEEIKENKTKGPIEDWDWDTWDDVDDPKSSDNTNNINKEPEVKKQENPDTERWSGWDTFGSKQSENQSNWGLWGVNMLLNKATAVTQGLSNVVEAGLGAPDPETFARMEKLERDSQNSEKQMKEIGKQKTSVEEKFDNSMFPVFGLTNLVAGVTSKIVEHSKIQEIGSKVITGGLDTLESFGKKTMEVLQEGDPGLKNKRALLLGTNKPILSQVLKEAKEKAEKEIKKVEEKEMAKKCHFEGLFDDFQGMVHLEALEMLSTQSLLKLEQLRRSMNDEEKDDLKEILEEVEQLCYLDEYDIKKSETVADFKLSLTLAVESLKNEISLKKMIEVQEEVNKWLENSVEINPSPVLVHQKVVVTLAQLTAATIHQFHKAGELLSVKECRKTIEEIEALSKMTSVICTEINSVCERFIKLSENLFRGTGDINLLNEKINSVMTDSTSYIKQAFNLLIPVLQVGAAA